MEFPPALKLKMRASAGFECVGPLAERAHDFARRRLVHHRPHAPIHPPFLLLQSKQPEVQSAGGGDGDGTGHGELRENRQAAIQHYCSVTGCPAAV